MPAVLADEEAQMIRDPFICYFAMLIGICVSAFCGWHIHKLFAKPKIEYLAIPGVKRGKGGRFERESSAQSQEKADRPSTE